jgi:predicted ATPase
MSEQSKDKIQALRVQNFTCFEDVSFEFSTGINLFIGENGTGKTHILKLLYAMITNNFDSFHRHYEDRLYKIFKTTISELLRNKLINGGGRGSFLIKKSGGNFKFQFGLLGIDPEEKLGGYPSDFLNFNTNTNDLNSVDYSPNDWSPRNDLLTESEKLSELNSSSLFVPCAEMLSLYPGFISAYNKRENSFDDTHYDLALALNANPLRNSALKEAEELSDILERALNIKVIMENDKFYIVFKEDNNRKVAAPLAAEGIKKLGQMIYLIRNGSLTKETVLFWDEPEVNLNPKYIRLVADFLMALARQGVQIFVATHDYLLIHYLSSYTEYKEITHAPAMKFFSFYKTGNGTAIETADTTAGIQNNVILDEYSALYDLEGRFFNQSIKM